jgi:PAS domain S-box-containing protein
MTDRGTSAQSPPDVWQAHPDSLALNRMGNFEWDLADGRLHLDAVALEIYDLAPEDFDGRAESMMKRLPTAEAMRMDALIAQAMKEGVENYGAYFRVRRRDGQLVWTHTQGCIRRDETGRACRVIGIVRDATEEMRDSEARLEPARRRVRDRWHRSNVVQAVTAELSYTRTVQDIFDLLEQWPDFGRLGIRHLALGLVQGGRIVRITESGGRRFTPVGERLIQLGERDPMTEAVRTLTPQFIESPEEYAEQYPAVWPHLAGLDVTAAAYVPLIAQGKAIGVAGMLYSGPRGFSAENRALLVALGSSVAQNLQRAMLYEQERDLAQGLQQAMLPRSIPSVPGADIAVRYRSAAVGCTPGRDIGGDWYDLIPLPNGRVGAVIGDVQGHDTHAAAVMGQLRIVLRAYATEGHAPATVMARASVFLHELDTDRFATCLYAEADLATGVVQAVRAGHIDPLVRRADRTCHRVPVSGGLPLGLSAEFCRLAYPVTTIELSPGETMLLCTDGLVEVPGADLDDGVRTLRDLVSGGPEDVRGLADRLIEVAAERGGEDDVALLLLRRRGPAAVASAGRLRQHVAPGEPRALSEARRMIRAAVRGWGPRERADEIELVADELITNALLHTEGAAVVTLRVLAGDRRVLRVEVDDTSSALPRLRLPDDDGVSGRGLMLVDVLADDWGVEARGGGKCVWSEFVTPRRG